MEGFEMKTISFVTGAWRPVSILLAVLSAVSFAACQSTAPAPEGRASGSPAASPERPAASLEHPATAPAKVQLARIVFVDQAECCHCTQSRIDATWAALQTALGTPAAYPVERLHSDTQSDQVEMYSTFKPIMVVPAVYFVGADNTVLDMLQGELRADQITAAIDRLK